MTHEEFGLEIGSYLADRALEEGMTLRDVLAVLLWLTDAGAQQALEDSEPEDREDNREALLTSIDHLFVRVEEM